MTPDLTAALAGLPEALALPFWSAAIIFLRVGGAMALLPGFGEAFLPLRVRLAVAIAFTLLVAPAVVDLPAARAGATLAPGLILSEAAIGLTFGLAVRLFSMALQTAGTMIAQATTLAQLFPSGGAEPMPAVSQLLLYGSLAAAMAAGLPVRLAEAILWTYDAFPAGSLPAAGDVADWVLGLAAHSFEVAFMLAMPFIAASVLYNVALGVINRAMPQLMVTFVGAPLMTLGALVLMTAVLPVAAGWWLDAFHAFLGDPGALQ